MQMYTTYLHDLALKAAEKYFKAEAELIEILQKIDQKKAFRTLGYSSLFSYATKALKLPENTAYTFITVARKAFQIPELKAEIKAGTLNISNAKRIAPILNQTNKKEWIEKAKLLPQKKLEQQIAREFPRQATQEKLTYVTETRLSLALGISDTLLNKLKRAQDLVSQSKQKSASFEETLEEAIDLFLKKKDPVEIATQIEAKKQRRELKQQHEKIGEPISGQANKEESAFTAEPTNKKVAQISTQAEQLDKLEEKIISELKLVDQQSTNAESTVERSTQSIFQMESIKKLSIGALQKLDLRRESIASTPLKHGLNRENLGGTQQKHDKREAIRKPLPTSVKHAVALRDRGRCTYIDKTGRRCIERRWLHAHHWVPVSTGGSNDVSNLMTLCSHHHAIVHQLSLF